jgi:hypothetical protein
VKKINFQKERELTQESLKKSSKVLMNLISEPEPIEQVPEVFEKSSLEANWIPMEIKKKPQKP